MDSSELDSSAHGFICTWIHLHLDSSAHGFICTWIHLHIDSSAHVFICSWIYLRMDFSAHGFIFTWIHLLLDPSWIRLHMDSSAHGFICTWIYLHLVSSAHGFICTWIHLHMDSSALIYGLILALSRAQFTGWMKWWDLSYYRLQRILQWPKITEFLLLLENKIWYTKLFQHNIWLFFFLIKLGITRIARIEYL